MAMSRRCATCILTPGGSSLVPAPVVRDLIRRHLRVGSVVVCHDTLVDFAGPVGVALGYAACAGFLEVYGRSVAGARVARLFGDGSAEDDGWLRVDPPDEEGPR
jgi:hypothetical protein